MDPFGHNHHRHHRRSEEDENPEDLYPPPPPFSGHSSPYPPPPFAGNDYPPPPFAGHNPSHPPPGHQPPFGGYQAPPPPHNYYAGGPPPPVVHHVSHEGPPPPVVHHVSHEGGGSGFGYGHHAPPPHQEFGAGGGYVQHVSHESGGSAGSANRNQPTVRIYTKGDENYSLSIRDGKVVLARTDHTDPHQHWIKDLRYSTKVKDEEGCPSFALINKVTGEAIKHSVGATHPVRLIRYNPDYLDESVLWAESKSLGDGFRCIRMVNNIRLNFDAFHGDKEHGGIHDGTTIVLWEWLEGKNQRWKIVPY